MTRNYIITVATFLYLYSFVRTTNAFSKEDLGAIERLVALGNLENEAQQPEVDETPFLGDAERVYKPYTLVDILNTKVNSEKDLCSPEHVRQSMLTGSLAYLIKCKAAIAQRRNNTSPNQHPGSQTAPRVPPVIQSYSGKLLKRLFANGLQKFSMGNPPRDANGEVEDAEANDEAPEKRSRLSINGALGSLADMLHQESRKHRRPVYAFHRELLHMG